MLKGIKYTLLSMFVVFKHLFKKPVTLEYPEKKRDVGNEFRGKPTVEGCIKCYTCTKVCPTGAIEIKEDSFNINLKKCIFCGNCAYYCPVKAIKMSKEYELGTDNVDNLKLIYEIEKRGGKQ